MLRFGALPIGTSIIAAKNFGPIVRGQLGIIDARMRGSRFLSWRRLYVCTFLGGIRVAALRRQIAGRDHGLSTPMLQDPFWFLHTRMPNHVCQYAADVRRPTTPSD